METGMEARDGFGLDIKFDGFFGDRVLGDVEKKLRNAHSEYKCNCRRQQLRSI
jgi:hypothetical protein